ncbi:MAG: transposase [Candidatus Nanohaloarchaea archaeon]|nr:transposase [Candidatus Nanohaloarchaea archaeon]
MEVQKTIKTKVHSLTNRKAELLDREYKEFQKAIDGEEADLYSATKQQVQRVIAQNNPRYEQPIRLRNDVIKVENKNTEITEYWAKIPVYNPEKDRGDSIWCPVHIPRKDYNDVENADVGNSKLVKKEGCWYLHLTIKKNVSERDSYNDIIAVDMGCRWIATSVALSDRNTTFYGKKVRQTREHFKQLRKQIGKKKVRKGRKLIKKIGRKESRKVEDFLHKISRQIVDEAEERNAVIAIGDLQGIRNQDSKGRKFNDKLHKFPFSKLRKMIKYKANEKGIQVLDVPEQNTSKTCNRCGSTKTTRKGQGLFKCRECGLEDNADKNGALNIGKRAVGKDVQSPLSTAGAVLAQPITPAVMPHAE